MGEALVQPSAVLGRRHELDTIAGALESALRGTFHAVLVEGEAGIGKTSLLSAGIAAARRRNFVVLEAHPEPGLPSDVSALPALVNRRTLPADRSGQTSGFRLVEGPLEQVETEAAQRPVMVVLDDLQWADHTTLLTVRAMMSRMRHLPVALLLALRSGHDSDAVGEAVQEIILAGGTQLAVGPLSENALIGLVTAEAGAAPGRRLRRMLQDVGGNPLYALELVRALAADSALRIGEQEAEARTSSPPPSLHTAVLRRLRRYGADAVHALRVGATLGTSFLLTDLAAVMDRSAVALLRDLDRPLRGGILGEHDDRLTFRHPLVREAIYLELPRAARTALHLEAGRRLAAARRPARVVASHLAVGAPGGDTEAITWLRRGAGDVLARDPAEAVRLLRRAADLVRPGDVARSRVEASLIASLAWAGQLAEALSVGRRAIDAARTPDAAARLRASLGRALLLHGRFGESIEHFKAALAEGDALSQAARGGVLGEAAIAHLFRGELAAAAELTGMVGAGVDGPPFLVAADSWIAMLRGEYDRAYRLASAAATTAELSGAPTAFRPLTMQAWPWDRADRTAEAEELLAKKLQRIEDAGGVHDVAWHQCGLGMLRFHLGRWDDAKIDLDTGLGLADELQTPALSGGLWPYAARALIAVHEGDLDTAAAILAVPEGRTDGQIGLDWMLWAKGLLHEARGQHSSALDALLAGWELQTRLGFRSEQPFVGPDLVRLAVAQGRREVAHEVTAVLMDVAGDIGSDTARAAALRCRGLLEADPELLLEAVAISERTSRSLELATAREHAGLLCAEAGRVAEGKTLLAAARNAYVDLGARRDGDRIDAALRALGVRRGVHGSRDRPQSGWPSLTDREREVAELVAEGLTNRQIGERLYVSPRTVGTHISHVLAKLGLRSRVELAVGTTHHAASSPWKPRN